MNYSDIFKSHINKLKIEGRYRYFNEIERKTGEHPNASWILDSKKNDVIVWCSNDYLGMSQNKLVINSMINSINQFFHGFHQLGQDKSGKGGKGKTVRVHTGSLLKALAKGRMPASVMLAIVFRRLAKSDYDRSVIQLIEVQGSFEGSVHTMVRWDRRDSEGEVFEEGYSVLKLDGADGRWKIKEGWTLDDPHQWDADRTGVSFGLLSNS